MVVVLSIALLFHTARVTFIYCCSPPRNAARMCSPSKLEKLKYTPHTSDLDAKTGYCVPPASSTSKLAPTPPPASKIFPAQPAARPISASSLHRMDEQTLHSLLQNSKAQADNLLEQQQVFEEALARNDATHEARLRRLKREAEERRARQAEAATVSATAAATAAAIGAHGRQAGAAVAAMAAAGVQAQTQQATAMAAQAAMFLEFQVCGDYGCRGSTGLCGCFVGSLVSERVWLFLWGENLLCFTRTCFGK